MSLPRGAAAVPSQRRRNMQVAEEVVARRTDGRTAGVEARGRGRLSEAQKSGERRSIRGGGVKDERERGLTGPTHPHSASAPLLACLS